MQHRIPVEQLGLAGAWMAEAVQACVHCGFCLATCPTYRLLGRESDSPRGRIYLMKGVLEGRLDLRPAVVEPLDRCLGCLACVTACPSGVRYDQLLVGFREHLEARRPRRRAMARLLRRALGALMPHPRRFRVAARLASVARPVAGRLPDLLAAPVRLLPERLPPPGQLAPRYPARGRQRSRVALLAGCVQQVLAPGINRAAIDVLTLHGAEVLVPAGQGCCGAIAMHTGMTGQARALARRNLAVLLRQDVDAVIVTAAGCGSVMKEYPLLFRGRPEEAAARRLAERVRDIAEWLDATGVLPPGPLPATGRLAYHDACHLAHAQGIREAPRRLLARIPGIELVEIPDGEICCGSAGTYNVEHPQLAGELGRRKAQAILSTGAEAVVTGNVGCIVQIAAALREQGRPLPVHHTVEVLAQAYAPGAAG